jgi:ABC-type nitrate/sulfonate/bicarbonate transport system substrate-binding protein
MNPIDNDFVRRLCVCAEVCAAIFFLHVLSATVGAQGLTSFRIANGTSGENPAVLWVGVEQGFYRKHGLNVETIYARWIPRCIGAGIR